MNPINSKAAYWLQKGLFDDLKSFADFESRVNVVFEEKDRGDLFEIFIEGYIATQAITQRVKHWVVGNIPLDIRERYNLPNDGTGIDGIYETHDGSHVAYQVKYRQNYNLTFAEVAPFLGITEKFLDRVIFTNATVLSHKAVVRTRWYSGDAFNSLSEIQLKQIEAWLKEKPVPIARATPSPSYQVQALADIYTTFQKHARATVVMACGTGKTLVALWAAEQANSKTVLVLLPSLTLLQQTLKEWSEQTSWGSRFSYLCVCSDKTVGLKNDEINIDKTEVGFRIDTDSAIVRQFLERQSNDVKVIFSTYHSTDVVAQGSEGLAPFDLGIFDEAHKTTGLSGGIFSHALSDEKVRINKRLFLTATPRHIDIRKRDKEGEFRVQSMDDETIYGPRAHTLSFGEAANKGIICRYKIIISLIDKQMVDDFTRNNGITLVDGDAIGARWVANLIALDQAVQKVDAKKIITFHSRVALAQEFATNEPRGIAYYLKDYDVRHVNGSQNSGERGQLISAFANSAKSVITNARCLTEGVNIPAVDMVAFIDPRQSKVDITQAVGRAMRKPRGATTKTVGYVLVPLFAGMDGEDLEEAIKTEKFDAIADVLNALQEHDEELVDIIRELQERKGLGEVFDPKRLFEKVEVVGPSVGLDELARSISIKITDSLGVSWDEFYGRLVKFKMRNGHSRVPQRFIEDKQLSQWVSYQRFNKDKISKNRKLLLDDQGFVWDVHKEQWEAGFSALLKFKEREGHCLVSANHLEDGFRLGSWVVVKRVNKSELTFERKILLDGIGFIWDPLSDQWEAGFSALLKFKEREGHCLVSQGHVENDFKLGIWVNKQRSTFETQRSFRHDLFENQKIRLDEIGFVWDFLIYQWESGFNALMKFEEREGHCRVPTSHIENGYRLGQWASHQRHIKEKLSEDRLSRLNTIGFFVNP
jgi:superfamily II DNA or RNA helicase